MDIKLITGKNGQVKTSTYVLKGRIAFPTLLVAGGLDPSKPKFSVKILFDEGSEQLKNAQAVVDAVSMAAFKKPDSQNKDPRITVYEGQYQMNATRAPSLGRPKVVNVAKKPLTEEEIKTVGWGSLCNVAVMFSSYDFAGSKGVSCYLQALQVLEAVQGAGSDPFEDVSSEFELQDEDVAGLL